MSAALDVKVDVAVCGPRMALIEESLKRAWREAIGDRGVQIDVVVGASESGKKVDIRRNDSAIASRHIEAIAEAILALANRESFEPDVNDLIIAIRAGRVFGDFES